MSGKATVLSPQGERGQHEATAEGFPQASDRRTSQALPAVSEPAVGPEPRPDRRPVRRGRPSAGKQLPPLPPSTWPGFDGLIGGSPQIQRVFERVRQAARSDCTVVVAGESGTGKELVAQALHRHSPRAAGPFLVTNMAAIPEGLIESELFGHVHGAFTGAATTRLGRFEAAQGGTLFVDEIGDLHLSCQAKLLRVLENHRVTPVGSNGEREVDVRVVTATNRDLKTMVMAGKFRADLYYRLNVVQIALPPLRERREDIPLLTRYFLEQLCTRQGRSPLEPQPDLLRFLQSYHWPGNVRQLHNCIESMVVMAACPALTLDDLPRAFRKRPQNTAGSLKIPFGRTLKQIERAAIERTLQRLGGDRALAAQALGISVRTLQRKLNELQQD